MQPGAAITSRCLWADDGIFVGQHARYEGHAGIDRAVAGLAQKLPNFTFTQRGEFAGFQRYRQTGLGFGPPGAEPVVTGIDVLITKNNKIVALYTFLDPPKK